MKKLHMLTAAAGILLALAGPSLAASRAYRAYDAYASSDRSGAYNYGPSQGGQSYGAQTYSTQERAFAEPQVSRGQNLPYPDRPYGAPDRW
jgi:hypothetical protein